MTREIGRGVGNTHAGYSGLDWGTDQTKQMFESKSNPKPNPNPKPGIKFVHSKNRKRLESYIVGSSALVIVITTH